MSEELRSLENNLKPTVAQKLRPTNLLEHGGKLIRSFGRIKSRKLSDHKSFLLKNLLPTYEIKDSDFSTNQKKHLEIGFGFGDFLFETAKRNPDVIFFGSEPHINGIVNILSKLEKEPLNNIKISSTDIRVLLEKFVTNGGLNFDKVYILFPDPWPKAKHFKRRLINVDFIDNFLSPIMAAGAKLTIATDHDSYKTWILSEFLRSKKFSWLANCKEDWQKFPDDWVVTKYQKKAVFERRTSVIFNFIHHG